MSKQTLVMKFGGTSVGSVNALRNVTQIVKDARKEYPRVVVITSAMSGVTNILLDCASLAVQGKIDRLQDAESALKEKHFAAADALIKDEKLREATKQEINALILSSSICARQLQCWVKPARAHWMQSLHWVKG